MSVLKVNKENFETEVLNAEGTVLVDFFADWCGPCKMLSPVIDEIAEEHTELKVCKVNVDDEPELASRYGVMSIPTLVVNCLRRKKKRQKKTWGKCWIILIS